MPSAEELYAVLAERYLPAAAADPFARAHAVMHLREAAEGLVLMLAEAYAGLLDTIREDGLTSDEYELRDVCSVRLAVDVDRARAALPPEVFADIVHVGQADAERILSRRRLYELAAAAVGSEQIQRYQKVNKADLEARVPAEEAGAFLVERVKVVRTEVVLRGAA
ncbi:MAG: hypothetical protein Q4Q04_04395 [Methanocorpusculum sp.]|nr:hypothetical protein [Methanocorpusculum sp.]